MLKWLVSAMIEPSRYYSLRHMDGLNPLHETNSYSKSSNEFLFVNFSMLKSLHDLPWSDRNQTVFSAYHAFKICQC